MPDMSPRIAICRHAAADDRRAVALARQDARPGIEASLFHDAPLEHAASASLLNSPELPVRYHFPLGALELSGPCETLASQTLLTMMHAVRAIGSVGGSYLTVHAALPSDARGTFRAAQTAARLRELVQEGASCGVTVALENLRWGLTSEPDAFLSLVESSGAAVTIDVGHATSSDASATGFSAERFVRECGSRVAHAHVYDRETDRHHPPLDLERIGPALDALCDVGCPWWTIELFDEAEVRATHALLVGFLAERYPDRGVICA